MNDFEDFFADSIDQTETDNSLDNIVDDNVKEVNETEEYFKNLQGNIEKNKELARINFARDIINAYRVNETEEEFKDRLSSEIRYEAYVKYNIFLKRLIKDSEELSNNRLAQFLIVADLSKKLKEMCELPELKELLDYLENNDEYRKIIKDSIGKDNLYIDKLTPLEEELGYKKTEEKTKNMNF